MLNKTSIKTFKLVALTLSFLWAPFEKLCKIETASRATAAEMDLFLAPLDCSDLANLTHTHSEGGKICI